VALTRAKRAMYVVIERPGETKSRNYPRLLAETLGTEESAVRVGGTEFAGAWSAGGGDWLDGLDTAKAASAAASAGEETAQETPQGGGVAGAPRRAGLLARRPSGAKPGRIAARGLFSGGGEAEKVHGRRVHALLAAVEWADGSERERMAAYLRRQPDAADWEDARREAEACLDAGELRTVFARGNAENEVWRERAFEAVFDGAWVSGVPDRVVVSRREGKVCGAAIYDFKTDRAADAGRMRERYAGQMELYREVVAGLLGLPAGRVECWLVATAGRVLLRV